MNDKNEYRLYCAEYDNLPLFHQPHWWDALYGDNWQVKKFDSRHFLSYMPYHVKNKWGFKLVRNPYLTPYSNPVFIKNYSLETQKKIIEEAKSFLKSFTYSEIDCNPQMIKYLSLEHFKTTYLLSLEQPLTNIHINYKASLRRQLKKANSLLHIIEATDCKDFYSLYYDTLQRRKGNIIPKDIIEKGFAHCQEHNIGKLFLALDAQNNIHAGIWLVWDHQTAYYLLGGTQPKYFGSGAMGMLLSYCIELAHTMGKKTFDFEGSQIPGVARFFSTFGAQMHQYPVLMTKPNILFDLLEKIAKKMNV